MSFNQVCREDAQGILKGGVCDRDPESQVTSVYLHICTRMYAGLRDFLLH